MTLPSIAVIGILVSSRTPVQFGASEVSASGSMLRISTSAPSWQCISGSDTLLYLLLLYALCYYIGGSGALLYLRLVLLYRRLRYLVVSPPCIIALAAPVLCCISTLYYGIGGSGTLLYLRLVLLYWRLRYFVVSPPCIIVLTAPVLCCISAL